MKKILLFIVFLAYLKGYGQEGNIVTGYDYIGRNTFHLGIGLNTYLNKDETLNLFTTSGVHLTKYEGSTRGIFEVTAACNYSWLLAGATYTPYAVIPKIGFGVPSSYVYVGYVFPTSSSDILDKGIAVGINIHPLYIVTLPLALIIGDPLK